MLAIRSGALSWKGSCGPGGLPPYPQLHPYPQLLPQGAPLNRARQACTSSQPLVENVRHKEGP